MNSFETNLLVSNLVNFICLCCNVYLFVRLIHWEKKLIEKDKFLSNPKNVTIKLPDHAQLKKIDGNTIQIVGDSKVKPANNEKADAKCGGDGISEWVGDDDE